MTFELGVLLAVLVQTGTIAWWASGITTMVKRHDRELDTLKEQANDPSASPAGRAVGERLRRLEGS